MKTKPNQPKPSWILQAKAMWGAQSYPFLDLPQRQNYKPKQREANIDKIEQLLALGCSGVLTGVNGSGKSNLLLELTQRLEANKDQVIFHSHSTLKPNSLIRSLCKELGIHPKSRKEDNIQAIHNYCEQQLPHSIVLIFDEASSLAQETFEEIRLLKCHIQPNYDSQYSLPILFCGDENLRSRLHLRYFKPLLSRLSFHRQHLPLESNQTTEYIQHHLEYARIHQSIFDSSSLITINYRFGSSCKLTF